MKARPVSPVNESVISDATGVAMFYGPSLDPIAYPADRADPDYTLDLAFDSDSRFYLVSADTTGWDLGTWTARALFSGGAEEIEAWNWYKFDVT